MPESEPNEIEALRTRVESLEREITEIQRRLKLGLINYWIEQNPRTSLWSIGLVAAGILTWIGVQIPELVELWKKNH